METEMMRPLLLLPEMLLVVGALTALLGGSFVPRDQQWKIRVLTVGVLLAVIVTAAIGMAGPARAAFDDSYTVDTATGVARILTSAATLLVLMLAADEIAGTARESESCALLLFGAAGTVLLAGADDLLVLAAGFLLATIPLYGLIGLAFTAQGAEAAMKTYLMGALFGILLLLGVAILSGLAGSTGYAELTTALADVPPAAVTGAVVALVAGLMFKAGAVPGHFWVPDAAQGASATAATFLTTVPKIGAVVAVYRLVGILPDAVPWPALIATVAVASMTLGNLAAFWQSDPRRLLGWSTVSQVGFVLVPVVVAGNSDLALPSLLVYLTAYTVTNIAAFAVTAALPDRRDLGDYQGLATQRPWLAAALVVALLGLVGTPPTGVFVGKLTTATAAWDGGHGWLAVVVFLNTLLSLFYYLRWIVPTYRQPQRDAPARGETRSRRQWSPITAVTAAALSLAAGLAGGVVWTAVSGP